jgi:branched-chain amino acid transport system permease protein
MKKYWPLALLAFLALLPLTGMGTYWLHIFILVIMWSVIGMAWNLLGGYCGQVSFGHAAFFGLGAYTSGILYQKLGISAWWGLPLSVIVVSAGALVIGFICLRLRGPFFALATLAMGVILRVTAENLNWLTEGDLGIMIRERTWVDKTWYFYIILLIAAGTYLVVKWIVGSKLGYYFVAIREDQDAAESLGINTTLYKTLALCMSAVLTGLAGAFYTSYMGYIDPKVVFALHDISIVAIMVVMVGGVATFGGPIVGAFIMVMLAEVIRSIPKLGAAHHTLFGVLLIVIIIYVPKIVGDMSKLKNLRRRGTFLMAMLRCAVYHGSSTDAALTDVSFNLEQGEILAVIGPNGAGKTTLFNVVNGFYPASKGEVLFKGARISGLQPHKVCRLGIARTFQVVKPLQRMSVLDNVIASAFLKAPKRDEAEALAVDMLKFTNLYDDREVISKGLPLGKRKRLEIARALATQPEVILLDESFAGLNPTELNESIEIIKKIKAKGITIMIIEHHMKVIMAISDRIVVLNYGEKIAEGLREDPEQQAGS